MSVVTVEGRRNMVEHLCEVIRMPRRGASIASCLQSGNPNRHSFDSRGSRDSATSSDGFWNLTIAPEWVECLVRECVRMTSRVETEVRAVEPAAIDFALGYQGKTPERITEVGTRRDQPAAAACVIGYFLNDADRTAAIESVWRMGGTAAILAPITEAMHHEGMSDLLITGRRP